MAGEFQILRPNRQAQSRVKFIPCALLGITITLSGCMDGGFLSKDGNADSLFRSVRIAALESDGLATGSLHSSELGEQIISASEDSQIVGSTAVFPPGSLAVSTEVTIGEGLDLGSNETLQALDLGGKAVSEGRPVAIGAADDQDTKSPFVLAIPLPSSDSGFGLQDLHGNIVVLYSVAKVGQNSQYRGIIGRDQLTVTGSLVQFTTYHFGTFQAVILDRPLIGKKEVADGAQQPVRFKTRQKNDLILAPLIAAIGTVPAKAASGLVAIGGFSTATASEASHGNDRLIGHFGWTSRALVHHVDKDKKHPLRTNLLQGAR